MNIKQPYNNFMNIEQIHLDKIDDKFYQESVFSKRSELTVFLDYASAKQAYILLDQIFSQHYPVVRLFIVVKSKQVPSELEDIQILFPIVKVYHRPNSCFVETVIELSKILDTQFVAAFSSAYMDSNKWRLFEAIGKIHNRENWKFSLTDSGMSFVALRLALEKAIIVDS